MNCPNCGAAMHVNAKAVFVCSHCGTNAYPEAIEREGIRLVGPSASALSCPLCKNAFVSGLIEEYPVDYCQSCHGLLLNRRDFAELVRRRRSWAATAPVIPTPTRAEELRRRIACAKCGTPMTTDWYYGPGNVIIDRCVPCDLVWLDFGELKQIVDAPGPDRGSHDLR